VTHTQSPGLGRVTNAKKTEKWGNKQDKVNTRGKPGKKGNVGLPFHFPLGKPNKRDLKANQSRKKKEKGRGKKTNNPALISDQFGWVAPSWFEREGKD